MLIYCDMDDILCETARALCGLSQRLFGHTANYEDIRDFNLQRTFSLTDEEYVLFMREAHSMDFLASYEPVAGAVEALKALRAKGHEVEILTGRPANAYPGTDRWLKRFGLEDFPVRYVNKYGRGASGEAGEPPTLSLDDVRARHYDIIIDDSPLVLEIFRPWTESRVLVFERPWNRTFPLSPNMVQVGGWREILALA